ncbi:hypothetical protein Tco_1195601 [Tanacetum coccineum]
MDAGVRYFGESNFDGLLIPFLLSSSLSSWLIAAMLLGALEFLAFSRVLVDSLKFLGPWFGVNLFPSTSFIREDVVSEQDDLPSSVELDFRARLDGGQMARSSNIAQDSSGLRSRSLPPADWSMIEILHDVVGTSGYRCGVLRSFPVERIEQGIG